MESWLTQQQPGLSVIHTSSAQAQEIQCKSVVLVVYFDENKNKKLTAYGS